MGFSQISLWKVNFVHSKGDNELCASSPQCLFVDETDDHSSRDSRFLGNWLGCTCTGVPRILHHMNSGQMAPVVESPDWEVCKFLLLGQRSRVYPSLPDDGTSLDGFETISVNLQITTIFNNRKRQCETNTVRQFGFSFPDQTIIKAMYSQEPITRDPGV